jgi:hypothetical protein
MSSICQVDQFDNRNNGLITKIWGPPGWIFLHSITFGYPVNPTEEQKKQYYDFFVSIGNILPCRFCRESYQKFIAKGETALTEEALENRESLTKWFYRIHEAVNKKLEINYEVTYDEMAHRYESFRARCDMKDPQIKGCITPLDYKAFSYKALSNIDCPVIPFVLALPFYHLAQIRNLDAKYFSFFSLVIYLQGNLKKLKKQESWEYRNKFCQKQIKYMRESGISCLETQGEWKGTPTKEELKLLLFLSSNMNLTEIINCIKELALNPFYLQGLMKKISY